MDGSAQPWIEPAAAVLGAASSVAAGTRTRVSDRRQRTSALRKAGQTAIDQLDALLAVAVSITPEITVLDQPLEENQADVSVSDELRALLSQMQAGRQILEGADVAVLGKLLRKSASDLGERFDRVLPQAQERIRGWIALLKFFAGILDAEVMAYDFIPRVEPRPEDIGKSFSLAERLARAGV